jgi:DHA2 family multidrug resistance protein-like MFS transporter
VALNVLMFSLVFLGAEVIGARGGTERVASAASAGILLLAAGIGVGVFYVRRQLAPAAPLFPVDLLRIPVFALSMCTSITAFAAQTLAFVALPFLSARRPGPRPRPGRPVDDRLAAGNVCVAPVAGCSSRAIPGGLLGGIGLASMAAGLAALAALPPHAGALDMAWRLALCGAGFGLFQSPNNHTIITSAPLRAPAPPAACWVRRG